jgi:hypothetical protein
MSANAVSRWTALGIIKYYLSCNHATGSNLLVGSVSVEAATMLAGVLLALYDVL